MVILFIIFILASSAFSLQLPPASRLRVSKFQTSSSSKSTLSSDVDTTSIGSANLDWPSLGFVYRQTSSFAQIDFKEGKWGAVQSLVDPSVKVHIGATALHYGQAAFEGLKAFHCKDGKVRIFRPQENARRLNRSARRVCMPEVPEEVFVDIIKKVVRENLAYLPPYGTGGALYIRPVLFGSGARIGLQPADEYSLIVMVLPVADYYRGGWKPVQALVIDDCDRAAPKGVGNVKVAGNYAADIQPNMAAKQKGFPIALYLDAKTNTYIEEFSTSNFIAIDRKGSFVTPKSNAILPSITNKSLQEIALDEGRDVQVREVSIDEVEKGQFTEIGACGTAVVLTPVDAVSYKDKTFELVGPKDGEEPILRQMYKRIRRIQSGEEEDKFNWLVDI